MEFDISKPQKLLRETTRAMLAKECPLTRVREWMASNTPHEVSLWNTIVDQGWVGLHLDENFGGLGLGLVELAIVSEEMGRACVPTPFLATTWASTLLAQSALATLARSSRSEAKYEGPDRIVALLNSITAGEKKATVALLEPDSDWDIGHIQMQLESISSGANLTGKKSFVLDADSVDFLLCPVHQGSEIAIVTVPTTANGVKLVDTRGLDATRKLFEVHFDSVQIAPDAILARGSQVSSALECSMRVSSIVVCAEMLGAMQWILDATLDYAKTRKQFDRTIGSYQAVQHQCADMLLMAESARAATYYAAWALQTQAPDANKAVAIAKAYCSDAAREVAHRGVQIHGGIGFTWEHDIHLYLKRIKVCEFFFGDATWQRERIATEILKIVAI